MKRNQKEEDITEPKPVDQELKRIEWLLTKHQPGGEQVQGYVSPYGDLLLYNTCRLILDSVDKHTLTDIVGDYLDLLDTSAAVYEKNGDYALGIFSSGWCRFMDVASRAICGTTDNRKALACGKWHCHESCWTSASKVAIETGQPVDIECNGGIRLYAVPVRAREEIVGCINFGYGDPPRDPAKLEELATKYDVRLEDLRQQGAAYESRPPFIIELAKHRLQASARLIGEIIERKQAEDALRETRDYLEKLFRYANAPIIVWDPSFQILRFNTAFERLTGYTAEEVIGKNLSLLFPPSSRSESYVQIEHSRGGESWEIVEIPIQCKDGSIRVALWNSANIYAEDGTTLQATIAQGTDITERKQVEERIRQVRSDLLFAVSHDLKTPLQALNQSQEVLNTLEPGEALARFQEYRQIWRRNLQRLERMINNLVDSQRGEEDRFPLFRAPCDPAEIVKRVVEDSQGYTQAKQVTLDLQLEPVPEDSCDQEALARVVENLLTNAVKFSHKGGRVEVRLRMEDQTLLLEVKDHGAGIPAEEQEQLFQPFQRGRSTQQKGIPGTGLGLYVCRRIVEEHGGTITLASEEGKGTKVIVRLPWKNGTE